MSNLYSLTSAYVEAFDQRDLKAIGVLMAENFTLTDPEVKALTPRQAVLDYIAGIFANVQTRLSFQTENIFVDGDTSVIEFVLKLDNSTLHGVDLIAWQNGKMVSMRAYLTS